MARTAHSAAPLIVALVLGLSATAHADVLKVGDRVAELDVAVDGDGKAFKLKNLKGKWFLITVGASWCKPCAKELPTWDKLAGELKDKVTFVAINADNEIETGKKFNAKLKLKNMTLVYLPADKSAAAERYGADTMPTTFVFDPKQIVKFRKDGFAERDQGGEYKKMKAALENMMK